MLAPKLDHDEEIHWLALKMVSGLGTRKAGQLLEQFRTPQAIFRASRSEIEAAGIKGSVAQSIASGCAFEDAVIQHNKMLESGAQIIPIRDPRYPELLKEIFDPPVMLFARGRLELLGSIMLGVVGTRRPTRYGVVVAERIASDLARASLTIVSGMARGIDTAAHRGTLACGGDTIAVFGCGVDMLYPAENRRLAEELTSKGLLLSELPMGSPALPQNFPIRNRIISGMSTGVLVVEGAQYSGSAITAKLASEQGREVFAVPGNITSRLSWGPNLLIKQGAKLVQEWNDVIVELPPRYRRQLIEKGKNRILAEEGNLNDETSNSEQASLPLGLAGEIARNVLAQLRIDDPIQLDELVEKLENCASSEIIAALFELEMLGLVRQLPGRNFVKVW